MTPLLLVTINAVGLTLEPVLYLEIKNTGTGTPEWGNYTYQGKCLDYTFSGSIHAHPRKLGALRLIEKILAKIGPLGERAWP